MREHAAWNVDTHMRRATGPTRSATRSCISPAALFVNVIARISNGETSSSLTRYASRCVSTRVLPEPAPAIDEHRARRQRDRLVLGRVQPREVERPARRTGASRRRRVGVCVGTSASRGIVSRAGRHHGPRHRTGANYTRVSASSSSVTGPSLTSATCMSARKRPVATGTPSSASACVNASTSGSATLGRRRRRPARPPATARVAVERELADDERGAAGVEQRAVHHAVVVVEHAQVRDLRRELGRAGLGVVVRHADEHAQARHRSRRRPRHRPCTAPR